jgi:hypothetical protein
MASKAPPPSKPAGVPPSGNGKFIAIALVLVGLIAAAVAWKKCQPPAPPPPVPVVDAGPPVNTGRKPEDDIPLPPPIEDAGPDAGKKIIYVQASNQCDAKKCSGSSSPELEQMLAFRVKQAHRCYDQALAQDPTLKGKISVQVRIGAQGGVCSAGVGSNDMGSPNVANCVVNYFRGANFPPPKGGCADINIPINFVPRQ